jgi:hypothetical protein
MSSITQSVKSCQTDTQRVPDSPLRLLHAIDLAEWQAEYHWWQFEELTLEAQRQLALYDEACVRRKRLMCAANAAVAVRELP